MINKIRNKFNSFYTKETPFKIIKNIETIRKEYDQLVLFGSPTQGHYLGIKNATIGIYPKNSIEIPQLFSNPQLTRKNQEKICNEIIKSNFSKVIISGFADYFFDWIELIHNHTEIEIIFHGTIAEFHDIEKQKFISKIIDYGLKNKIQRFGFVKIGLDEVFKKLYNLNTFHQPLNKPITPLNVIKLKLDKSKIHIGIFGIDNFNKNLHNQVINSLLIENTIIHVLDKTKFQYLKMNDRIVGHGTNLSRLKFLSILGSMHINLYMSYSESWGLIKYESEKMEVPCLAPISIDYNKEITKAISKLDGKNRL